MPSHNIIKAALLRLFLLIIACGLAVMPVHAALVSTASLLQEDSPPVLSEVDRGQIEQRLVEMGVTPKDAAARLDALSEDEVLALNTALESDPAGGNILVVAAIVFLVLLFTDIMGYTDLFPFVKKSPDGQQGPIVTEEK